MRSDAKASTAGPNRRRRAARRCAGRGVAAGLLATLACMLAPAAALAGTVTDQRPFLFAFDGSDSTAGRFDDVDGIAVDNATGAVYVANGRSGGGGWVSRFGPGGAAAAFASTGASSLSGEFEDRSFRNLVSLAVDNSGGPNQGRLHVGSFGGNTLFAFAADGTFLWRLSPPNQLRDVGVDDSGHPWLIPGASGPVRQYASSGTPPQSIVESPFLSGGGRAIDVDSAGNLYLGRSGKIEKWVGGVLSSTLDASAFDVYVDQSSPGGHLFTSDSNNFQEFDASGALVGTYGGDYVRNSFAAGTLAYNPTLNRVFVAQQAGETDPAPVVAAFGPPASGTVPDLTIDPASGVGIATAHLSGTVDPQGQTGTYHFEYRRANSSWAAAQVATVPSHLAGSSPAQALPAGPGAQPVEFDVPDTLRGGTAYEARLVTVNAGSGLRSVSAAQSFTTAAPPAAPAVTISPVGGIGTTEATVGGTVDPEGDTADWRAQLQTGCAGSFAGQPLQRLTPASSAPEPVSFALTGLLPSQRYCARISATNGAGTTTSGVVEFETAPALPSAVEAIPAAPRLATSARLNGRVNPEGAELTYRFEYSADGGATWTSLPADTRADDNTRVAIVVGRELTGLSPDTEYRFRLLAETGAGSVQSGDIAFRTRTTAEVSSPAGCPNEEARAKQHTLFLRDCRGIELVNDPDKGNQDVQTPTSTLIGAPSRFGTISPDGERATWSVRAGAPGAPNGTSNSFLSRRGAGGWTSSPIAPPPAQQLGGGDYAYRIDAATPDFTRFFASAGSNEVTVFNPALVRIDDSRNQEVLATCPPQCVHATSVNVSDDGAHVVGVEGAPVGEESSAPRRLVDVGSGAPETLSIMPDGSPNECSVRTGSNGGYAEGGGSWSWEPGYYGIAATDASRVYFQARPNANAPACNGSIGLYVRNRETGVTTLIDPGLAVTGNVFIRATHDGRSAFFTTVNALDPADENDTRDVYRWNESTGESACLTCFLPNPEVSEDVRVSDDYSHVYFQSRRQLVAGEGVAGDPNLYVLRDGDLGFIADPNTSVMGGFRTTRISADGNVLLFALYGDAATNFELTADPLPETCPVEGAARKCPQLFRYDDRDGSLECLSCRHDAPTEDSAITGSPALFALSADGSTAIFLTDERLVPADVNGEKDIYMWRDGVRSLITDGVSDYPQGDASPLVVSLDEDGSDVFFSVAAPGGLTGFESDGVANLYDARIGGGFPPPSPPEHCDGDSCQGPIASAPSPAAAASAGFSGRGNQARQGGCGRQAARALRLSRRAERLRRVALRTPSARQANRLRHRAARLTKNAKRLDNRAKRCRRANRRAAR